jgi:hypothetical protein
MAAAAHIPTPGKYHSARSCPSGSFAPDSSGSTLNLAPEFLLRLNSWLKFFLTRRARGQNKRRAAAQSNVPFHFRESRFLDSAQRLQRRKTTASAHPQQHRGTGQPQGTRPHVLLLHRRIPFFPECIPALPQRLSDPLHHPRGYPGSNSHTC